MFLTEKFSLVNYNEVINEECLIKFNYAILDYDIHNSDVTDDFSMIEARIS